MVGRKFLIFALGVLIVGVAKFLQLRETPEVGQKAPEFSLSTPESAPSEPVGFYFEGDGGAGCTSGISRLPVPILPEAGA